MNDGMEETRPEVAGLGGENSLTGSEAEVNAGVSVGDNYEMVSDESTVGTGGLPVNDLASGVEPSVAGSVVEPAGVMENNSGVAAPSEAASKKKLYYLIGGGIVGAIVLIFAGVGVYSAFFEDKTAASVRADMKLRQERGDTVSIDDISVKDSSEITDEERKHNTYAYYKVDTDVLEELQKTANDINERFMSSEISFDDAKKEYEKAIDARSSDSEKAFLLLYESDLAIYAVGANEEGIALAGDLIMRAEEISSTIASAGKLAGWEQYYGSKEKAEYYYQLMNQRQVDEGYINEVSGIGGDGSKEGNENK